MGPIWPRGWQGYQQINKHIKKQKNNANAKHPNENTCVFVFNVRRFPQNSEGSTAGRLWMFYEKRKMIKLLYKTEHKETQKQQKMSQPPSKE